VRTACLASWSACHRSGLFLASIFWERSTGASNGSPGGTDDDEQEMSSASSRAITALFLATNLRVWVLIALGAKWLFEFLI
jgi:hypothetical protein